MILALALLALTATFARFHPFDDDEFQHAHYAWLLHHGARPFQDFFEHHLPAYHLLVSPVFAASNSPASLFVLRFISWACLIGTLAYVYVASRRLCSGPAGPTAAVLLVATAPIFLTKMVEARPESAAILCFAAALHQLLARRNTDSPGSLARLTLAGLLAGAMPALSHKFGLSAVALVASAFVMHGTRRGLLFAAASTVPLLILVAWAAAHGILADLYRDVFALAVEWKHRFSPTGYLASLWQESALLVTTGLAGLVYLSGASAESRRQTTALFMLLAAATATLFLVPEPYRQSFLPLFPLLAIGAAVTTDLTFRLFAHPASPLTVTSPRLFPSYAAATIGITVLAAATLYPCAVTLVSDLQLSPTADLQRMRAADATGSPRFFDGRGLMFYRAHTGRHACIHQGIMSMLDPARYATDTIEALREANFPTVIMDYRVLQMPSQVQDFIRNHYLPLGDDLFVPGFRIDRSRLVGRPCKVQIPVGGRYRTTWRGGKVRCDGQDLVPSATIPLAAGEHVFEGFGFVDGFTAILTQRSSPGPEAAP
jgi:hypothetical protein